TREKKGPFMSMETEDQHTPDGALSSTASTGPHSAGTPADASAPSGPADASAYYAWDVPDGNAPDEEEEGGWTGTGVAPFQVSEPMPVVTPTQAGTSTSSAGMPSVAPAPRRRRFPGLKVLVLVL